MAISIQPKFWYPTLPLCDILPHDSHDGDNVRMNYPVIERGRPWGILGGRNKKKKSITIVSMTLTLRSTNVLVFLCFDLLLPPFIPGVICYFLVVCTLKLTILIFITLIILCCPMSSEHETTSHNALHITLLVKNIICSSPSPLPMSAQPEALPAVAPVL